MQSQNPFFIPRNYLVEEALEDAVSGAAKKFNDLMSLLAKPYSYELGIQNIQKFTKVFDESVKIMDN